MVRTASLRRKAERVCDLLSSHYGTVSQPRHSPPVDELVLTILSQNTADVNSDRAFTALKKAYSGWDDVLAAPAEDIAEVIKSSGFFRIKAQRIKAALAEIMKRVGRLDLSLLKDMDVQEARAWLMSLYGVGPKTAAIVLLFSFGMPVLPVDTHVWRVSKRLGLIDKRTTRERAHTLLVNLLPQSCILSLNQHLVKHGREVCTSRNPHCHACFLRRTCNYFSGR